MNCDKRFSEIKAKQQTALISQIMKDVGICEDRGLWTLSASFPSTPAFPDVGAFFSGPFMAPNMLVHIKGIPYLTAACQYPPPVSPIALPYPGCHV